MTRFSVQPWNSSSQPCASEPRCNSRSSRSHCAGLSRSAETGSFERKASAPFRCHTRRQRRY
ncbi:hypothetical protein [Streptomyces sp. NPDC007856]|uniref:hypothetical protein n=1 Tax=Streptomyces sp. NPDC007856 TaxID=3364781 RepID=UPI0036959333